MKKFGKWPAPMVVEEHCLVNELTGMVERHYLKLVEMAAITGLGSCLKIKPY